MFEKIKNLFKHKHKCKPTVGFINEHDDYIQIVVNSKCRCGHNKAQVKRLEKIGDSIRVPYDIF